MHKSPVHAQRVAVESLESRLFLDAAQQLGEVVTTSTLTSAVTSIAANGKATVTVSNISGEAFKGPVKLIVIASQSQPLTSALTPGEFEVGFQPHALNIAVQSEQTFTIPVKVKKNTIAAGSYTLWALVADKTGASVADDGPTFTVAPAAIILNPTETLVNLPASVTAGEKTAGALDKVSITNTGNVKSTGKTTVALYLSPDDSTADGTLVATRTSSLGVNLTGAASVSLPIKQIPSAVVPGIYNLITQVTDPAGDVTVSENATLEVAQQSSIGGINSFSTAATAAKVSNVYDPENGSNTQTLRGILRFHNTTAGSVSDGLTITAYYSPTQNFDASTAAQVGQTNDTLTLRPHATLNYIVPPMSQSFFVGSEGIGFKSIWVIFVLSDNQGGSQTVVYPKPVFIDITG